MIQKLVYSRGNKTATSFLDWMKTEQKKLQTGTAKPATKRKKNVFVRMTKPKYKLSSLNLRGVELNGTWKRFASDKIFTLKKVSPRVVSLSFCSTLAAHVWLWKQTFFSIFFVIVFFCFWIWLSFRSCTYMWLPSVDYSNFCIIDSQIAEWTLARLLSFFRKSIFYPLIFFQSFFFLATQEIATLTHKFSSVTLYKNKTIRYAARLHAIIACQMEFQLYPMDIQICPIYIESFSYSNSKVRLKWAENGVNINPELKLLQYNLGAPLQLEETDGYMPEKDGNYSRLTVYFRFERQIGELSFK